MYIIYYLLLFCDVALLISSIIELNVTYIIISSIAFIFILINIISFKKQIKESAKLEMAYFDLIKKISKDFKEQNFDEIYKTLRKLRKTEWYKMIDKQYSSDSSTNMNQFYDIDKYKIDEFE